MIAYHGKQEIKDKFIKRIQEHRRQEQILQFYGYWHSGKGCAVGCTIHSDSHIEYEKQLGIPERIAYLEDAIFEGLPFDRAKSWPEEFLIAIPVGADLSLVWHRFAIWLLTDSALLTIVDANRKAIAEVAEVHRRIVDGIMVTSDNWKSAAESAARSAESAARSAAWSARSAESAARSAARSAESAARSAARSAAESAESAWCKMADKLLVLLAAASVMRTNY